MLGSCVSVHDFLVQDQDGHFQRACIHQEVCHGGLVRTGYRFGKADVFKTMTRQAHGIALPQSTNAYAEVLQLMLKISPFGIDAIPDGRYQVFAFARALKIEGEAWYASEQVTSSE